MTIPFDRRLLDLLEIEWPIIQAPMAAVSTPAMAAAVSNAGGLGSIGIGATDADSARNMIAATQNQTNRSINVNVFCHRPAAANAQIEAAWLARLRPEFERFGAAPPVRLKETYRSFHRFSRVAEADERHRAALRGNAARHTTMTRAISGRPARSLANRFTELGHGIAAAEIPAYPIAYDAGKALNAAAKANGEPGYGAQWAGQGAPLARALPAAALVAELVSELTSRDRNPAGT